MNNQMDLFSYPNTPGYVRGSDTSKEASESIDAKTLRGKVLAIIAEAKGYGRICDECEKIMNGRHQTISARIRELVLAGKIKDSGKRRKARSGRSATVYVAQ